MSTLDRDDAMLDGLGLGGRAPSDDPLAGMLVAWRDGLTEPPYAPTLADAELSLPGVELDRPSALDADLPALRTATRHLPIAPGGHARTDRSARTDGTARGDRAAHTDREPATRPPTAPSGRLRLGRPHPGRVRPGRLLLAAALLVAALGGGVTVAAGSAGPGSALFGVTRLVYAERADSRVAARIVADLLSRAATMIEQRRYADAAALLEQAMAKLPEVRERGDHERLRAELARLLDLIAAAAAAAPAPAPSAAPIPPSPGTATPAPRPSGTVRPSPTAGSGGLLPGLPPLPPILPSLLPDLPLL